MLRYQLLLTMFCSIVGGESVMKLTVLHTNDMHARFNEISQSSSTCTPDLKARRQCYGGYARLAYLIRTIRARDKNVLVLNAGDTYTGTPYFTEFNWTIATEFNNLLEFDALSLGNHEFDLCVDGLLPYINGLNAPVLCANILGGVEIDNSKLKKSTIVEVDGLKVGIIGYLTKETPGLSGCSEVKFQDEIEQINNEAKQLKEQGAKTIIALGHSGFDIDKKIARNCPLVDLVVGGHTNTFLFTGKEPDSEKSQGSYPTMIQQSNGKKVPVVQAFAYTKYLGELFLEISRDSGKILKAQGNPILVNYDVPQESDILDKLKKYTAHVEAIGSKIIGSTAVVLEQYQCRIQECNIGNLLTDAMVAKHTDQQLVPNAWTDSAIGVWHSGGIRTSLGQPFKKTPIKYGDLMSVIPFNDVLFAVDVSGEELMQMLKISIRGIDRWAGGFLQVSGLHITYDLQNGLENPNINVRVRCARCEVPKYNNVNPNSQYRVLMLGFLAHGGDGYDFLVTKNKSNLGVTDIDFASDYIKRLSPIIQGTEERIKIINKPSKVIEQIDSGGDLISAHCLYISLVVFIIQLL